MSPLVVQAAPLGQDAPNEERVRALVIAAGMAVVLHQLENRLSLEHLRRVHEVVRARLALIEERLPLYLAYYYRRIMTRSGPARSQALGRAFRAHCFGLAAGRVARLPATDEQLGTLLVPTGSVEIAVDLGRLLRRHGSGS